MIEALEITGENELFCYRPFESLRDQRLPVIEVLEITREGDQLLSGGTGFLH